MEAKLTGRPLTLPAALRQAPTLSPLRGARVSSDVSPSTIICIFKGIRMKGAGELQPSRLSREDQVCGTSAISFSNSAFWASRSLSLASLSAWLICSSALTLFMALEISRMRIG